METSLNVTFRNMEPSPTLEDKIREYAVRLERIYPRIISCHVVVEAPHRHAHYQKGKLYHVAININVPGHEIAINRAGPRDHAHEDAYVAARDAFNAATRRLQDYTRQLQGQAKQHSGPNHGIISKLFPEEGYGFVTTPDGQEVYFHRNSVTGDAFGRLRVGAEVRISIAENESEKGFQASTLTPIGKHHPPD